VALVVRQMSRVNDFAIDRTGWELLLTYLPFPDEAVHLWYGYLDPSLPSHDPALAARLRPFLDDVLRLAEQYGISIVALNAEEMQLRLSA